MRSRLQRLLRSERGIALPAAVMMMFIMGSLGIVVVSQSTTSGSQAKRDRNVKRSIAAADAGVDTAIYRLNKLQPLPLACVVVRVEAGVRRIEVEISTSGEEWCPEVDEDLGEGASYRYRVSTAENVDVNGFNMLERRIVSIGQVGPTERRVKAVVRTMTGSPLLGDYAIISRTELTLPDDTRVDGKVGSNGRISITDSDATLCGDAWSHANDFDTNSGDRCPPQNDDNIHAPDPYVLSPVDQKGAPSSNNNNLLTGVSGWDSSTRMLRLGNGANVTLTGSTYSLCYLELTGNAQITIPLRLPTQGPVEIFMDKPEDCQGAGSDAGNVKMLNTSRITNLNADPTYLTLYQVGSPNQPTTATFDNDYLLIEPIFGMVVYSPNSTVSLAGESSIRGAIGAETVILDEEASVHWDPLVGVLSVDNLLPLWVRQSWVECRSRTAGPDPDSDCS